MASRGLGVLTLDLVTRIGGFTGPLDKAGRELDRKAKAMQKTAANFGKVIGASLVAGATAFGFAVKAAIDQADQLNEVSKKIGIPTDVLSGLNYAAKLSGVATEELQAGLVKMIKFQAEAAAGAKKNVQVFSTLGIAIKDSAGNLRGSEAVFRDFAEIFKRLPDGPEKTALALKVFGKAGAEMIPLLNEGKAGLAGMAEELDKLGGTVTPEAARAADEFNDNLDKLKVGFGGLALQVATDLLPELNELTGSFIDSAKEGGAVSNTAHNIADAFRFMADATDTAVRGVQALTSYSIALYGTLERISSLNPGVAVAKLFGGNTSVNIGTALDQANHSFDPARPSSRRAIPTLKGFGSSGGAPDISGLFKEAAKGAKKQKEEVDKVAQAYERMKAQMQETIALYHETTEVAKLRYQLENDELLKKLLPAQKEELLLLAAREDLLNQNKKAREEQIKLEEEANEAAMRHKDSVDQLLSDIAFETSLLGLNNDERERMIALRGLNGEATAEEAARIEGALTALQSARKADEEMISAMDDFRGAFSDSVTDVLTGASSISDAFKSLADTVVAQIARIIANQLTASLFGEPGSTTGGSAGGWLSSLFSAFLPKHAAGTNFAPGGPSIVGERGPEIVNLRRGDTVTPNHKLGASVTVNINGGGDPRETALQAAREVRRVLAFSGRG